MKEHQSTLETERAEEFLSCLGRGRSIIEIEQDEDDNNNN
jgi:hypothetical protein